MDKKRVFIAALAASLLCGCGRRDFPENIPFFESAPITALEANALTFPVEIPDVPLVAEELISYQGPYWEDGSGEQVENVAALMVYNPTEQMVQSAVFAVDAKQGTLYFYVSRLPPESRCLVLEKNRKGYISGVSDCRLLSVRWIHSELSAQQVNYVGLGPVVTITNREERMYSKVLVWYKRYVPEEGYYLGGSAYSACLLHLQPGEQRILKPQMYDSSCARVVRIEVNE